MLTIAEKDKIKDILSDGLKINRNINFPYYLDSIIYIRESIKKLDSKLSEILYNQNNIDIKLNKILSSIK